MTQRVTVTITPAGDVQVADPVSPPSALCDSSAALATRAAELLEKLPAGPLARDTTWQDSTSIQGCRGSIPTTTTLVRHYVVLGQVPYAGLSAALRVHRTEAITASGHGVEGQHRVFMFANGTGAADLYFDTGSGRLLGLTDEQTTDVDITTSGQLTHFVQRLRQQVTLVP